ncbi:response regulator transcription factor [Paucibacter sp. APW11]|uniref:Response regulator transcription factor n=1 Tax=Roseateles aquae TaxID=3077235 RepID=A0ABU3PH89_9BURK|nr:response regulator transcription factor [Paucibacter sp. APW11]MDT9001908.1 response regulator transcription factor [Paucibacter sp. APW11]
MNQSASRERLLLVEDDPALAAMLVEYLGQAGYGVVQVGHGQAALAEAAAQAFGAVVLDLGLPDIDGLDVCRQLRARSDVPVLMLTARGDAMDRVLGLELGADDYLAKPFLPRELLARLRALLRRRRGELLPQDQPLRFGRLEIAPAERAVTLDGRACELSASQFDLLLALARHAGRVMSREALMDLIGLDRLDASDRSIDLHITKLRAAIEDDPRQARRIITVRGAGYVFAKAQD